MDDVEDQYQPPRDHQFQINFEELSATAVVKESNRSFPVRGAPWEKKKQGNHGQQNANSGGGAPAGPGLDTTSAQEFPAFGGGPGSGVNGNGSVDSGITLNGGSAWGRKN